MNNHENSYIFNNKTAIVTGSSSGIGLACVKLLLEKGLKNAVITSFIEEENVPEVQILQDLYKHSNVLYVQCDVRNKEDMENLFDTTMKKFGHLDILVNNAGIFNEISWSQMIDINLKGTIHGTKFALEKMSKENGGQGGTIINVSSLVGLVAIASAPVYVASKHAIIGYTKSMALPFHFNKTGVRVMALCPGLTNTSIMQNGIKMFNTDTLPMMTEWESEISSTKVQDTSVPAKCLIKMLTEGKNASIWMAENEEMYELLCPEFKLFERA